MLKPRLTLILLVISFLVLATPSIATGGLKKDQFVGTYTRTFIGASGGIKETLVLKSNMTCTLKSVYDGRRPIVQTCKWSKSENSAKVTFKDGEEANNMTFKLQGNQLIATEYDKSLWGAEVKYRKLS
jgi:hypothetical protein